MYLCKDCLAPEKHDCPALRTMKWEQQQEQRIKAEDNAKNAEMAQMRQIMTNMESVMQKRAADEKEKTLAEAKAASDRYAVERNELAQAAMAAGANAQELHQINSELNRQQLVLKMEQNHAEMEHQTILGAEHH